MRPFPPPPELNLIHAGLTTQCSDAPGPLPPTVAGKSSEPNASRVQQLPPSDKGDGNCQDTHTRGSRALTAPPEVEMTPPIDDLNFQKAAARMKRLANNASRERENSKRNLRSSSAIMASTSKGSSEIERTSPRRDKNRIRNKTKIPSPYGPYMQHQSLATRFVPQSLLNSIREDMSVQNTTDSDRFLTVFETLASLTVLCRAASSKIEVASAITLALNSLTGSSVTSMFMRNAQVWNWCIETFGYFPFQHQAEGTLPEDNVDTNWLTYLPQLQEKWDTIRNAPVFSKISALITVAASIGMCSVSKLSWNVKGVEMFRHGVASKQYGSGDFVSAMLDTVTCFMEGGYECFKQGSITPLFFTENTGRELDELYFPLLELHEHALVFNLHNKPVKIDGVSRCVNDLEYGQLLDKAVDLAQRAYKASKGTWQQGYLEKRLAVLHANRAEYNAKRIDGTMRYAPFTIYIWGDSGVGKSTIASLTMLDCLSAAGVDPDLSNTATIKESDKYDSTLKGDTAGIFLDDMGNTKKEFLDKSPTDRVIDINNNMITYAQKADLHEKGKIEIRPRVFVITSNAPLADHANTGSINPFSIVRRGDIHLFVKVKPEFQKADHRLDTDKVLTAFPGDTMANDVWDIEVYRPREKKKGGNNSHLIDYSGSTTEIGNYSIDRTLDILTDECKAHFERQNSIVTKAERMSKSRRYCKHCRKAATICKCGTNSNIVENMSAVTEFQPCSEYVNTDDLTMLTPYESEGDISSLQHQAGFHMSYDTLNEQMSSISMFWHNCCSALPDWLVRNRIADAMIIFWNFRDLVKYERRLRRFLFGTLLLEWYILTRSGFLEWQFDKCFLSPFNLIIFSFELVIRVFTYVIMLKGWREKRLYEMTSWREITPRVVEAIKEHKLATFLLGYSFLKNVYDMMKGRSSMNRLTHQSALQPTSVEEIKERDKRVNPWAKFDQILKLSDKNKTMTSEQVLAAVKNNLCHIACTEDGYTNACDILALGGNAFLIPMHMFKHRRCMKVRVTRKNTAYLNSSFPDYLDSYMASMIPEADLAVCILNGGGPFKNILHLFPEEIQAEGSAKFLYRDAHGELTESDVQLQLLTDKEKQDSVLDTNTKQPTISYKYQLDFDTFDGLCMGVCVGMFSKATIACVHTQGFRNKKFLDRIHNYFEPDMSRTGFGSIVTRKVLQSHLYDIETNLSTIIVSDPGTLPEERYGIPVIKSEESHPKSAYHFLEEGARAEFLGQAGTRSSYTKSKVEKTPISDTVARVCGVGNDFGPPRFHRTRMWQASLVHSSSPSPGVEPKLLEWAARDYVDGWERGTYRNEFGKFLDDELRPLDMLDNMSGIDGKLFIDAVKKNTSKGFPLSGPKRELITFLDPQDYPSHQCPVEADAKIIAEMHRMENLLADKQRCYFIFSACPKDEPTKVDKDKVRIFQAADWASQLLIRKYFLPIARVLSVFPIKSECAVGINSNGPDWDEMAKFINAHGKDRIVAGDYSKYDLRMPAQLILAAFKIMITFARRSPNYTSRDITVMKGIATEIAYSCTVYNGDLLLQFGSNPSGHNMTVYINCIVNSLLLRCAFARLCPTIRDEDPQMALYFLDVPPFRSVVNCMTYGDDFKLSVAEGYDWFNHVSYAQFLKERGMVLTMPNKTDDPVPFMHDDDADFLKRKNKYNPDTGLIAGALDEDSIFKSLHSVLKSSVVSLEDQSRDNIGGALREWWHHGKITYEMRRKQMRQIAEEHDFLKGVKMLDTTYEDYLLEYRKKYLPEQIEENADVAPDPSELVEGVIA